MAIDRSEVRRRVRTITAWVACGAAVLTAGAAFGAARGGSAAKATAATASGSAEAPEQDVVPEGEDQYDLGFQPPSASSGAPQGMSGGS
jgi:hypothetical protein